MANVSWSTSIQIAGGPTITATQGPIAAEAIDHIEVSVPHAPEIPAVNTTVDLQPGPASSIHLLLIKSSSYGDGTDITFKTNNGTVGSDDSEPIALRGPQFYSGGAIELLGTEPNQLKFSNTTGSEVQIEVFVARDAIAPAPAPAPAPIPTS